MKKHLFPAFALAICLLSPTIAQADSPSSAHPAIQWKEIEAQFVDGVTGKPISGANITLFCGEHWTKSGKQNPDYWVQKTKLDAHGMVHAQLPIRAGSPVGFRMGDDLSKHRRFGHPTEFERGEITQQQLKAYTSKDGPMTITSVKPMVAGRIEIQDEKGQRRLATELEAYVALNFKLPGKLEMPMEAEVVQGRFYLYSANFLGGENSFHDVEKVLGRKHKIPLEVTSIYIPTSWDRKNRKVPVMQRTILFPSIYQIVEGGTVNCPGADGKMNEHVVVIKRAAPWTVRVAVLNACNPSEPIGQAQVAFIPEDTPAKVVTPVVGGFEATFANLRPVNGIIAVTKAGYEPLRLPIKAYADGKVAALLVPLVDIQLSFADVAQAKGWVVVQRDATTGHFKELGGGLLKTTADKMVLHQIPDRELFVGLMSAQKEILGWQKIGNPGTQSAWVIKEGEALDTCSVTVRFPQEFKARGVAAHIVVVDDEYGVPMTSDKPKFKKNPDGSRSLVPPSETQTFQLPAGRKYRVYMRVADGGLPLGKLNPKVGFHAKIEFDFDPQKYKNKQYPAAISEAQMYGAGGKP